MANASIRAAFERMWLHIVAALGNKADSSHTHNIADISTGSADDIIEPLTLRDIRTNNDELHTMLTGNGSFTENYAYIYTTFLSGAGTSRSRTQVAIGYQYGYIAVRSYYAGSGGGWSKWNMLLGNQVNNYSYGASLPTAGIKGRIFFKKVS